MPLKPKTIEKLYWTIGEVADELGVNNSTIRFWEKEFGMSAARRTGKGDRQFTAREIDRLKRIKHLVKDEGFTIQGAREQLKRPESAPTAVPTLDREAVRAALLRVREGLLALRQPMAEEVGIDQR